MIENVQIINKNGDSTFTEGISYIENTETGKKYLFYTLNEKVDNDLTKIYISETSDNIENVNTISQEEWDDLRKKMVKISHKEPLDNVNFLSMNNVVFNVGEPKKLAVTSVAKQSFKDAQLTNTMSVDQNNESVLNNTAFFNGSVAENNANQAPVVEEEQPSIFSSPQQPVIENVPIETSGNETVSPKVEETVIPQNVIAGSVENEMVDNNEPIITDEEALQAISIIREYIDQESNA